MGIAAIDTPLGKHLRKGEAGAFAHPVLLLALKFQEAA